VVSQSGLITGAHLHKVRIHDQCRHQLTGRLALHRRGVSASNTLWLLTGDGGREVLGVVGRLTNGVLMRLLSPLGVKISLRSKVTWFLVLTSISGWVTICTSIQYIQLRRRGLSTGQVSRGLGLATTSDWIFYTPATTVAYIGPEISKTVLMCGELAVHPLHAYFVGLKSTILRRPAARTCITYLTRLLRMYLLHGQGLTPTAKGCIGKQKSGVALRPCGQSIARRTGGPL
jgi:hypothetical protein